MFVVAIFMSLPAICLIYGWRVRVKLILGLWRVVGGQNF